MSEIAKITLGDKTYELPVISGSEDEKAIDISKLRAQSGYITIDTGFKNTGSTKSAITFLDGEKGILRYRGYPIEQLADQADFLEVAYLLVYGNLPNKKEYTEFKESITHHTLVHEDMRQFLEAYPAKAHPMGILSSLITIIISMVPFFWNHNTLSLSIYAFVLIAILGIWFTLKSIRLYIHANDLNAKKLMIASIFYLPLLQIIYIADKFMK